MSTILISSLVLVLIANMATSDLVSSINYRDVQIEPVNADKYNLRIKHSDGSTLEETVERNSLGQYEVRGRLALPEYSQLGKLFVFYQNDDNGSETKYQFVPPQSEGSNVESATPIFG